MSKTTENVLRGWALFTHESLDEGYYKEQTHCTSECGAAFTELNSIGSPPLDWLILSCQPSSSWVLVEMLDSTIAELQIVHGGILLLFSFFFFTKMQYKFAMLMSVKHLAF